MFCPKCGTEQTGEPNYCVKCGQRLKPPEPAVNPAAGQDGVFVTQTQNVPPNNANGTPETKTKNRHGCLATYLILLLVVFAGTAIVYIAQATILKSDLKGPAWKTPVELALNLVGIICVIALFRWKKWGFWGICGLSVVTLAVNILSGENVYLSVTGLLGIAIIFGVLNIGGKDDKGWTQLD
jgi:hypothetical protein